MEHATFKWLKAESLQLPRLAREGDQDSIQYDEPFEEYLRDRSCISSSGIRAVLNSPQHFLASLMGFNDDEDVKPHFRFGRAVHTFILEPRRFQEIYVIQPEFTGRTKDGRESAQSKEAREAKARWYSELPVNAEVVTQEEIDHIICMAESLMRHPQASNLLKNGRPEVSGRITDPETGLRVKARCDYLTDWNNCLYISDIKSTRAGSEGLFSTEVARNRYHVQLALYADVYARLTGRPIEAVAIIGIEKTPPYTVFHRWLSDDDLDLGRAWYKHGLRTYRRCLQTGLWPASEVSATMLNLPVYAKMEALPEFDFGGGDHEPGHQGDDERAVRSEGERDRPQSVREQRVHGDRPVDAAVDGDDQADPRGPSGSHGIAVSTELSQEHSRE